VGTECDLGRRSNSLIGKEEGEREVAGGGLELRVIYKACWRVSIGRVLLFGGGSRRDRQPLSRFSGQVRARAGKGERGEGRLGVVQGF
jgi:hypothetical protein